MSKMMVPPCLATEVFAGNDIQRRFAITGNELGPAKVARVFNKADGRTWGFVVIDNLTRGPGLGGTRMAPDVTVGEVYGLASAMTLKNAAAMLPIGGGKSAIVADPRSFHHRFKEKRRLIELFAEAIWPLTEYVPGPDMGTDERDMQTIYESFTRLNGAAHHGRGGVGRPPDKGGLPIDEWGLTAHGLFAAARTAEECLQGFRIEGARVVVQGYGNVGSHIASKLYALGACVVGASDVHCALYDPQGLDVGEMNRVRHEECGLRCYAGEVERRFSPDELDELMWVPCDILIPAARPCAIGPHNCDKVDAKVILQGANNPVDSETERCLRRRGIINLTDFIVNAGGVIACAVERKMDLNADYRTRVLAADGIGREYLEKLVYRIISENVREIEGRLASSSGGDLMWRDAAVDLARSRLRGKDMRVVDELL